MGSEGNYFYEHSSPPICLPSCYNYNPLEPEKALVQLVFFFFASVDLPSSCQWEHPEKQDKFCDAVKCIDNVKDYGKAV